MIFQFGVIGIVASMLMACSHSATKDVLTPDFLLGKGTQQITFLGDNDHPRFAADGSHLLYQSRQRGPHRGWQIYEMDLDKKKERRITFSDGDAFDAVYVGEQEIIYASTTDEIKEGPLVNRSFDKDFPPSDIYMSDLYGTDILRLTRQPGYDGELLFLAHGQKPSIYFTSRRGELLGVYRLDLQKLPVSLISAEKDKSKRYPALTPDQQSLAWVEKDLKTEVETLVLFKIKTKVPLVLKSGEGQYRDLFFAPRNPQRLFYSVLRKGEKKNQLEVYNIETNCTQVVFKGADSLYSPTVSDSSTERLAFTRLFQDKRQIYSAILPADLGPCLETLKQDTLKK
jgi:hypothetical protein